MARRLLSVERATRYTYICVLYFFVCLCDEILSHADIWNVFGVHYCIFCPFSLSSHFLSLSSCLSHQPTEYHMPLMTYTQCNKRSTGQKFRCSNSMESWPIFIVSSALFSSLYARTQNWAGLCVGCCVLHTECVGNEYCFLSGSIFPLFPSFCISLAVLWHSLQLSISQSTLKHTDLHAFS